MSTKKFGSRNDVYDGVAQCTRGGLTKEDLMLSKTGKIVSKKKSLAAAANYAKFGFKKREAMEKIEEAPVEKKKRRRRKKKVTTDM